MLPLDPRLSERLDPRNRIAGEPRTSWTYFGNHVRLPEPIGPLILSRGHTITADVVIPPEGAEGVITCAGAFSAGWSLYVLGGNVHFAYTLFDIANVHIDGTEPLPAGKVTIKTEFTPDGKPSGGGVLKLFVNGKPAGEATLSRSVIRHGLEPFEVGRDSITPVSPDYHGKGAFPFTGKIDKIQFELIADK